MEPISVSERLPELTYSAGVQNGHYGEYVPCANSDNVLAYDSIQSCWVIAQYGTRFDRWIKNGNTFEALYVTEWSASTAYINGPDWEMDDINVTHWLPLPPSPITQEKTQ